jgi:Flp pilus assembly protein TadG
MARILRFRTLVLRKAKKLTCDDNGVTLIEFGLLALPFFIILGAIIETGLYLFGSQVFDGAVDDASRSILIGRASEERFTASDFRNEICKTTFGLIDCSQIKVRVRPIGTFASANTSPPVDEDGNWALVEVFRSGQPRQVMLVEAYYKWRMFTRFNLGFKTYGDSVVLSSARVFMNEPFPNNS